MAERELIAARAKAETSQAQLAATVAELKHRLKPSTLASDAWHGVKDKSSDFGGKGVQAVRDRPAVSGGALAALALFLLRGPIAHLLGRLFGGGRADVGTVRADLSDTNIDYDLTAPVVTTSQGVKA